MARPDEAKIASYKKSFEGLTLQQMAQKFVDMQQTYDDAKAASTVIFHELDYLKRTTIPEKMDDEDINIVTFDGIGKLSIKYAGSAKQLDKEALAEWLREHGHESMIKPSINSSSLSSFMKNQIDLGEEVPDSSIVEFHALPVASITQG